MQKLRIKKKINKKHRVLVGRKGALVNAIKAVRIE